MQVTNKETNIKFNAIVVNKGGTYGLNNCLTHDKCDPLVEIYDARYPHTSNGQFVSRYYLSTFMEIDGTGLCLDGGIPDWYLTPENCEEIKTWINSG